MLDFNWLVALGDKMAESRQIFSESTGTVAAKTQIGCDELLERV